MADKFKLDSANTPEWLKVPEQFAREIVISGTEANKAFNEMILHAKQQEIECEEFIIYITQNAQQIKRLAQQEVRDQQTLEARKQERLSDVNQQVHHAQEPPTGKDVYQLEAAAAALQKEIFGIDENIKKVEQQIERESGVLKTLHHEWVDHHAVQADAFLIELKEKLASRDPVLDLRNEKNEKIELGKIQDKFDQAIKSIKSPTELLKVNPALQSARKIMLCNDVVCELRMRAGMIDGETNSKNLLSVIKNNKQMPVYRHSDKEEGIAEKAIEACKRKRKAEVEEEVLRTVKRAKEKEFVLVVDELRSNNKRPQAQPLPKQSGPAR